MVILKRIIKPIALACAAGIWGGLLASLVVCAVAIVDESQRGVTIDVSLLLIVSLTIWIASWFISIPAAIVLGAPIVFWRARSMVNHFWRETFAIVLAGAILGFVLMATAFGMRAAYQPAFVGTLYGALVALSFCWFARSRMDAFFAQAEAG